MAAAASIITSRSKMLCVHRFSRRRCTFHNMQPCVDCVCKQCKLHGTQTNVWIKMHKKNQQPAISNWVKWQLFYFCFCSFYLFDPIATFHKIKIERYFLFDICSDEVKQNVDAEIAFIKTSTLAGSDRRACEMRNLYIYFRIWTVSIELRFSKRDCDKRAIRSAADWPIYIYLQSLASVRQFW